MLNTLAFRMAREVLPELLGTVMAYPLSERFQEVWNELPAPRGNDPNRRQPYAALAHALTAATGQRVRLFGERDLGADEVGRGDRMLLVTDKPLGPLLRSATRAWERQVRGRAADVELADLLPDPEPARPLADYVRHRPGEAPTAPGWVFRIATWKIMCALAVHPLRISPGRRQRLQIDTDGSLLAWDTKDVMRGESATMFGMSRISAKLTTRAGVDDLVVTFDAHVSRFRTIWAYAKNTWLYRGEDKPILRIPVRRLPQDDDKWITTLHDGVLTVLEACGTGAIDIQQELPAEPGDARPTAREFGKQDVGSGQGPRYMARLHEHVRQCLPLLAELTYDQATEIAVPERKRKAGELLPIDVRSTGFERILIVCLYDSPSALHRMLAELRAFADGAVTPLPGGSPVRVADGIDVAIRRCPELLAHGPRNRSAMIDEALGVTVADGQLVVAWVETQYHPNVEIVAKHDAKPYLRRLLARRGIPSQFLATDPPEVRRPRTKLQQEKWANAKAHAARSAFRELFRLAGATGEHLRTHTGAEASGRRLDREALFVGVHARRQQTDKADTPLVLTMVAVHARPDAPWSTLMASDATQDWRTAAEGITDFHTGLIGDSSLGRTEEKAARTRAHVDELLGKLVTGDRAGIPMVIFVDTAATRTIWPGLQDMSINAGALPGDLLIEDGHDVAIVRLNDDVEEIGRPVHRHGHPQPRTEGTPGSPGRKPKLYRLAESVLPIWLFPRMSRLIDSPHGRYGTTHTRWTLPEKFARQMGTPWHAYTATEILVVRAGSWQPEALAAITASMCEHPVSWDGRTAFPVPLHLAVGADRDHPDHRVAS